MFTWRRKRLIREIEDRRERIRAAALVALMATTGDDAALDAYNREAHLAEVEYLRALSLINERI